MNCVLGCHNEKDGMMLTIGLIKAPLGAKYR
jgi:hypothetical protein